MKMTRVTSVQFEFSLIGAATDALLYADGLQGSHMSVRTWTLSVTNQMLWRRPSQLFIEVWNPFQFAPKPNGSLLNREVFVEV